MRLIIKGAVALFLLLAISIPLCAQYVVQGVVTDSLTKEPLPYASVRLKGFFVKFGGTSSIVNK